LGEPALQYPDDDSNHTEAPDSPSKSERKRQSTALLALGEELLSLPEEQLARLDLPDTLREALQLGRSITAHGGLKRQKKYIGKLLRHLDTEPLLASLEQRRTQAVRATGQLHHLERWRDRLLGEDVRAIDAYMAENPGADRQKLRQLVRDARAERENNAPPRAARLLFRYLKALQNDPPPPESGRITGF